MRKYFMMQLIIAASVVTYGQNTGIGTSSPSEKLHVAGNVKSDTVKTNAIQMPVNAGQGKVLTSDATGNALWQNNSSMSAGNVGFGVWGDCATNGNITEYKPFADAALPSGSNFGVSVAVSGNFAVAGAYLNGSASFYQHNGTTWEFMQKVSSPTGDFFGQSVSISGNYAIIGAYNDFETFAGQGSASIYHYNGSSWVLMQKLTDPLGAANDQFGSGVSISGNYAVVGAKMDDQTFVDQGSASVFNFNGSSWVFLQKIVDPSPALGDQLGHSVGISGNRIIVGSWQDDVGTAIDQGSALVYQFNGTNFSFSQKLTDVQGLAGDNMGRYVSISDNDAVVGSFRDDVGANGDQGSAIAFHYNGATWQYLQKLIDENGGPGDWFGFSISVSENYLIVGNVFGNDIGSSTARGAATIYMKLGPGWQKLQYLTDPGGNINDHFGVSAAIDGRTKRFIIGAEGYIDNRGKVVFGKLH